MNNGIRLNNFERGINDNLKSIISMSQNDVNIYEELFTLEFDIIFNKEHSLNINNETTSLKGISFKNIIDRINILLKINENNSIKSFYFYDIKIFQNNNLDPTSIMSKLNLQNNNFNNIMNKYLQLFSTYNNLETIQRKIFMEIEPYVLVENRDANNKLTSYSIYNLLDYINQLSKSTDNNILISNLQRECINKINMAISDFGGYSSTKIQYWLPFITPNEYAYNDGVINETVIKFYSNVIKSIQQMQSKLLSYSFILGGPSTSNYDIDFTNRNNFLYRILDADIGLKDYFDFYTFYDNKENEFNLNNSNFNINNVNFNFINSILNLTSDNKEIYFTNQGISINPSVNNNDSHYSDLENCGYNEINNDFLLYKEGIYTFKNKLISYTHIGDILKDDSENYSDKTGLIYCNIDSNQDGSIPYILNKSYFLYRRINNISINFNVLTDNLEVVLSSDYNQITFYDNEDKIDLLYIMWTNNDDAIATLQSHYARKYYKCIKIYDNNDEIIDYENEKITLNVDYNVLYKNDENFIIIVEDNVLSKMSLLDLQNKVRTITSYFRTTIQHLVNILPESYNKEIIDTNYYKLLRAIALQLGDLKFILDDVKNGFYLNALDKTEEYLKEVKGELIYKNFGSLIDLPKKSKWTDEQYRNMVTAVINALIGGPTVENMKEAITTFTGYNNRIYELYKEKDNYMFSNLKDLDFTYRFAVQVIKDINKYDDAKELMENLIYLLNIIKPAQALFIIYIIFEENEMYDTINRVQDVLDLTAELNLYEPKFGMNLRNTFELYNHNDKNILLGHKLPPDLYYNKLGLPIYKVNDVLLLDSVLNIKDTYKTSTGDIKDKIVLNTNLIDGEDYRYHYKKYNYYKPEENEILLDKNGNPIKRVNDNDKNIININLSENINKQIQINTYSEMKKMNTKYKKEIYFENKDLILNIQSKDNIKVFLNGVLISYNNYDLIEYLDNYAYGIKLNNNIYTFKDTDMITIMYLKIGNYLYEGGTRIKDNYNLKYNITKKEKDFFVKPLGFKLLGNLPQLLPENIYKLKTGQLSNIHYIVLGTLQDRHSIDITIKMSLRNNKEFTEEELRYIDNMERSGIKVNIID